MRASPEVAKGPRSRAVSVAPALRTAPMELVAWLHRSRNFFSPVWLKVNFPAA